MENELEQRQTIKAPSTSSSSSSSLAEAASAAGRADLDPGVGDWRIAVRRTLQHQLHTFDDDVDVRPLPHHRRV